MIKEKCALWDDTFIVPRSQVKNDCSELPDYGPPVNPYVVYFGGNDTLVEECLVVLFYVYSLVYRPMTPALRGA